MRRGHRQVATGNHALPAVDDVLRRNADIARGVARVIRVDPGLDDAVVGQLAAAVEGDTVPGRQVVPAIQVTRGLHVQGAAGIDRTLRIQARGLHIDGATGGGLDHAQLAVGIELDIAAAGRQIAGQFYPYPGFGPHQLDGAGVHATQHRGIDRHLWLGAAVIGTRRGLESAGVNIITTGNNGQLVGIDLRVDGGGAGDDFELVDVAGVKTRAIDGNTALVDLITRDLAVGNHHLAGGQRRLRRIDKTTAVTTDAIRVGDDHMGGLPRHFGVTTQLARTAAIHFVEDDIGRRTIEILVAEDNPAQLRGLGPRRGVVEDDPVGPDVVVAELVMRQPLGIRRGDIDDRYAIACLTQRRPRRIDHDPIRLGQQWLPEHRVR